uniref:Uncharacterized protein n=2 Tax=Arion vulgaris TaxID=1028688 RepID=A0A0B7BK28_9EUPU
MYNEINIMTRDFSPSIQVINDNNGKTLTEKKDVLERWREYCRNMYEDTSKNPHKIITESEETEPEPMLDEVRLGIKSLKRGKSPECDDIPAELIQACGEASVRVYHKLCTKIWNSSSWRKEWKRSVFIPYSKEGKHETMHQLQNYCPYKSRQQNPTKNHNAEDRTKIRR